MQLIIPNKDGLDTGNLIDYLIDKVRNYINNNLEDGELDRWDTYLNYTNMSGGMLWKKARIPSTKDIILGAAYNLIYHKYPNKYVIEVDQNTLIPNTLMRYTTMINLINYGNLSINGYTIMDKAFSDIVNNFTVYIKEFESSN